MERIIEFQRIFSNWAEEHGMSYTTDDDVFATWLPGLKNDAGMILTVALANNFVIFRCHPDRQLSQDQIALALTASNQWNTDHIPYLFVRPENEEHVTSEMLVQKDWATSEANWHGFILFFAQTSLLAFDWLEDEFGL